MKRELRPVGKHVWCLWCLRKKPPLWEKAAHLVPLRKNPYDLTPDGGSIDLRMAGICKGCLHNVNEFQSKYKTEKVDTNNEHIVYYEVSKD